MWSTLNKGWMFPLRAADDQGAGAGLSYDDDKPVDDKAKTEGVTPPAKDDAQVKKPDLVEGEKTEVPADEAKAVAKAAREAELAKMSPEDRAKAEAEDATAEAEEARLDTVPEDGKYDLKMPEGIEVDSALLDAIGPEFKALELTNGQAQALADKFIAATQARLAKASEDWATTTTGWVDTAKKDPEIGGGKWDQTVEDATGVIERFGTPELKEYLTSSRGGNQPEMIRWAARIGAFIKSKISEDDPIVSDHPGAKPSADAATVLYPNDQPKGK